MTGENLISIVLFLFSIGIQLTAAIAALLLIRITRRKSAWILISLAMGLMAGRRAVSFISALTSGKEIRVDTPELIALAISALMLFGVLRIRGYFLSIYSTEAALAEEKYKSNAIIEAAGDGISIQDTSFKVLYQNQRHKELLGEHIGEYCYKAYENNQNICNGCPMAETFKDGRIHTAERHTTTEKGIRYVEITASSLKDAAGNITAGIEIARDITEKKKMEAALRESEGKYRDILENANDLIQTIDENARFIYVNKKWKDILGYSDEEIKNLTLMDILDKDTIPHCVELFEQVKKGKPLENLETIFVAKNRRKIHVEGNISPKIIDGKFISTRGIFRDITARKQSKEFIKHIFGSINEGLVVISPNYRILTANPAYCIQTEIPLENMQDKTCYEISHHSHRPCYEIGEECPVKQTFETGLPSTATHMHFDKEGNPIYLEIRAFPMKDESGKITSVIEIFNNITERTILETQLRHSQKIEAVGILAGGIAHDFNNILSAIIGYGHLMLTKVKTDDPMKHYAEQILNSAERAAALTQGLLSFSRKKISKPAPVNINETIKKVEQLLSSLLTENIEFKLIVSKEDLTAVIDTTSIEQVLINLCTNSRDAMPDGGTLAIATHLVIMDEEYIRSHGYGKKGRYALISVTDTGIGMDKKTREKIFEPFFTTKEVGKGTGLGLAIVYGIIKQHNGYIDCYSKQGKGTTFRIYLPLQGTKPADAQTVIHPVISKGTGTILIAEDDADVRKIMKAVIESAGYSVIEAANGKDAVDKFTENKDSIDLLLLDVIMPQKSGEKAYEEIAKIKPGIRAIFVSGYSSELVNKKYLMEEKLNFIQKPISPNELINKIRKILER
ncbi:MAG: PAS domain S-box protein [Nitrospirae bacterium]|nr:PAS domain S-box protein [Nitrospirota bacterium]